jgi:ureidoglycolate lyase
MEKGIIFITPVEEEEIVKKVKLKELTREDFNTYGTFAQLINPDAVKIGDEPVEFFRDMAPLDLGINTKASFSVCRVVKRPPVVDVVEYHDGCGEGILPLDADVLIHVAPATPKGEIPLDSIEVYRVPKGTFVSLHAGVWHHAPFVLKEEVANVLVVLPERTYAADCEVYEIPKDQQVEIDL